ncbi:MAG: Acetyltransferase family [Candidatus Parcubacteria bacterium]|jgi:GNAT superfamily N-acetyltransferase
MEDFSQEKIPQHAGTLTADQLYERICRDHEIDPRFLPIDAGGVFKYFFVNDLSNPFKGKTYYQVSPKDDIIAGLSELEVDPHKKNNLWIKFISVDPAYQGQGHAKVLAEEIVRFAKEGGYTLEHSSFSDEGKDRIYGLVDSVAKDYGVEILNPAT